MGWVDEHGKPAHLVTRWQFDFNRLVSKLKDESPVGLHTHDRTDTPYGATGFPRTGGRLRRSWHLAKTTGISGLKRGADLIGVTIKNTRAPYWYVISEGGNIPAVSGKGMHFNLGGGDIRTGNRAGYRIQASNLTQKAVDEWSRHNTASGLKPGIAVEWK